MRSKNGSPRGEKSGLGRQKERLRSYQESALSGKGLEVVPQSWLA